jgi:hypothetical protein
LLGARLTLEAVDGAPGLRASVTFVDGASSP